MSELLLWAYVDGHLLKVIPHDADNRDVAAALHALYPVRSLFSGGTPATERTTDTYYYLPDVR